jgi:hypothetical protein
MFEVRLVLTVSTLLLDYVMLGKNCVSQLAARNVASWRVVSTAVSCDLKFSVLLSNHNAKLRFFCELRS